MSLAAGILPGYGALLFTRSLAIAIAAGIPLSMVPLGIVVILRRRRFNAFEEGLPKVLDMMVSALRAGHSFNAALGLAAREGPEPISSEFRICFDEQNFGLDLRHAMENLMTRVPLTDLRIAATAVLIQKETGGNLAEVLDNTSEVIRERARLKRQMRVHTAHGRMTGWVIGCLPFALFIVLYILNPQMESMLWKHEMGIKLLYGGGAMMVIGVQLNMLLLAFNLLPIPPLDGSQVLKHFLPARWARQYQRVGLYGIAILILILWLAPQLLTYWLQPANTIARALLDAVGATVLPSASRWLR